MKFMKPRTWYIFTGLVLGAYAVVSALLGRSQGVTVFGNLVQQSLLVVVVILLASPLRASRSRDRAFWALMSLGAALWAVSQVEWVAHEVFLRTPVPDVAWADILLFFHPVPWIAALLVQAFPYARQQDEQEQYTLDFAILLLWSIYLYVFMILAWQLPAVQHLARAGKSYSVLYLIENLTTLVLAGGLFARSRGRWRTIYRNLILAEAAYVLCSGMIHYRLLGYEYYTGCLYDLPLVAAICLTGSLGIIAHEETTTPADVTSAAPSRGKWATVLAALALVSMPTLALWSVLYGDVPREVATFRMNVTLLALPFVALLFLQKQRLLNRQLQTMLQTSEASLLREQQLRDRLVESGKLAALGQLVAGIAHEINNPLTAIVGYADILETGLRPAGEAQELGKKLGVQAKRTKHLVESMLNFARQTPLDKTWLDVNSILQSVMTLQKGDVAGRKVAIRGTLADNLPPVSGNSNQLLQVFVHLINNARDAMEDIGGGSLDIVTRAEDGNVLIEFSDTGPGVPEPDRVFDAFYTTKHIGSGPGLGLSTCYGIIAEHGGTISCQNRASGHGATFLIRLPGRKVAS
jgi:signal transduction histidine kinase